MAKKIMNSTVNTKKVDLFVTKELSKALANQHLIYQKARHFHWNVVGPFFQLLHEFFEEVYTDIATDIDQLAERIRALGYFPTGNYSQYLKIGDIKETKALDAQDMLIELGNDLTILSKEYISLAKQAERIDDLVTQDMCISLAEKTDVFIWKIQSQLL